MVKAQTDDQAAFASLDRAALAKLQLDSRYRVSGYYRTALRAGDTKDAVRVADRPNIRVDNGNIADSGAVTGEKRFPDYEVVETSMS